MTSVPPRIGPPPRLWRPSRTVVAVAAAVVLASLIGALLASGRPGPRPHPQATRTAVDKRPGRAQ